MRYSINNSQQFYIDSIKEHLPCIMGSSLGKVVKTSKFDDTYKSRAFNKDLIIKKLFQHKEHEFQLTFRQFLKIDNGLITYNPTPTDFINKVIDDAILKFNLFKSFVFEDCNTGAIVHSAGLNELKFDFILDVRTTNDGLDIINFEVKSYYSLFNHASKKFYICIKDKKFLNPSSLDLRYNQNGKLLSSSSFLQFIRKVEAVWEESLDFNNLRVEEMKTVTSMILI